MSSRRVMQRSYSGDGRTGLNNGDDVSGSSGSSRPASRSYLSDVRPESSCSRHRYSQYRPARSTLCSVMAQLTEETQPTIDVTLKSKAVSEKSKVTFTCEVRGHPIPDVIWYKDDVQLDRYCGLPKYEIFRNGPNHSLHIYNCTMEDAAIYQASASNTKGIVSCSGVLEVGLMNEYLIHQRYFSKLKQKAETRRRELGVQENQGVAEQENQGVAEQEPLRNLSPDRSQRKRRSPMAPHFSAPSSMEEVSATTGEHHALPGPGAQAAVEARLRDPTSAETVEKPAPVANGTPAAPTVNGHAGVTENGGKGITYVYDSVQKVFAAHQPKTPFAKKKIKISNSAEGVKADAQGERVSEERSSNVRACETQAPTELVNTQGPLEEVMEVERSIPSTPLDLAPPANTEAGQKRATETVLNVDKTPSKEDKICLDTAVGRLQRAEVPTQKKKPVPNTRPVNVSPAVSLRNRHGAHGTESKQDKLVRQEKVGDRDTKKNYLDSRSQKSSPKVSPAQRQPALRQPAQVVTPQQPLSSNKKQTDIKRSGVTAGDIAVRPTAAEHQTPSTAAPQSCTAASVATSLPAVGPLKHSDSSCPTRQETTLQRCLSPGDAENAFPQSPGEPGGKKETSSRLENVSVSEPQQLAEVTQAHARPNRTSPPVGLKPPAPHCAVDEPLPQRTPSEGETMTAGGQTAEVQASSARRPVQGTRRAAKDHSRGSSERNSVPFTDPAAFLDESLGYGQSSPGCSVSHAVKTEEGLEIPVERKVEGHQAGTLQVCEERQALSQMKVEMEADVVAMKEIERAQIGATLDESQRETVFITHAGVSQTEMNNEPVLKSTVETHPIMHKTNITGVDTSNEQVTMEPGKINVRDTNVSEQQMNPLKEAHKPGPNVLSVAEIMRSQIKALESTLSNPLTVESNSATVESIASTPHIALSTEKAAAPEKFPDLREDLEKGHDMERVLAIEIEQKIETKPPEQPPKSTPPTTEPITSFSIPPYRGEDNVTAQDVERTIEKEQRVEAMPVSTPEVPDTAGKQVGLQPRLNPPECTPEQPQTKPQTPAAQTTEAITSFSRGALGTRLDVERPIDIKQKIETKPVSTPEVPDATAKQFGFKPRINPTECTPEQPQTKPQTPAAQTTEAITSFSRGALGTGLDVERPIDVKQKIETKPVSTPEVPDATGKQVGLQPRLNPPECTPEQPQTPTAPTTEAITCYSRGEDLGKELNVERPIEIESKMDTKSVSTPEVPDTTAKQFEFQPTIYQQTTIECTPNQPLTPTAPTSEAIIAFSIPPISVSDTESMAETGNTYSRMENDSIVDTGHACGTSSPVSLGDSPDPPPAAATDEMTTITCCSNASLMEVDFKDLTDSNSSVIMSQEHRKSLLSGETGMYSVVELCCTEDSEKAGPSSEQHSPKQSILDPSSTDEGFKQIPPPEIKLNSESHLKSTPVLSPTCVDAQKTTELNRSTVEIKQDDMIQQERNLFISIIEPTTTAIAPPTSSSNDEAPLQEVKSDAPTVPSATPKDLALGARRKIFTPKSKTVEDNPTTPTPVDSQPQSEEVLPKPSKAPPAPATLSVPPGPAQQTLLDVEPNGQRTPPVRRRSPLLSRKVTAQETLQQTQAPRSEEKSAEKEKHDPLKAPQVIRKIRGESFSDASGHLKLWCQFFNVLSDSVISWYMDDVEIAQVKRSAGDETPVNLAIIQASKKDCGVYGCKITNDHGTDITDLLLSIEILGGMRLREDLGVGEEIEMAPLLLNKGVADCGVWGSKFFGRVMVQESHIGGGCSRKTWRAKVVYGLEPVFESGTTCVIKMCNRITYGGKGEAQLTERNVEMERQKCRIQSLAREYCKIFSAESRLIENFGPCLEVIPVYLMYRPANTVPYATVEADLKGVYLKYCKLRAVAGLVSRTGSEVELKCCALQHWIYQWTNGNLLLTQLEGVDNKLTNVGISVKSTGYQGLSVVGNPAILEQFVSQHQCNYYCGLLSLRSLKTTDSLQTPSSKSRGSKSPLLQRKTAAGAHSPQTARRAAVSPRLPRKADGSEQDKSQSPMKQKELHATNVLS